MKLYEILDGDNEISIGVLIYYEKKRDFIIELREGLDEWTAPLLFTHLIKTGIYTVPRSLSLLWVQERIIPKDRQNISQILKTHHMNAYDEMKFLEISKGRCSQDGMYVRKMNHLPQYVIDRRNNLVDCVPCRNERLLCFFENESVRLLQLSKLSDIADVEKILRNPALFGSAQVGTGGYFITFNDSIDLPAKAVYEAGKELPLTREDFIHFSQNNVLDTSESCEILECSRQNLSYLGKSGQLHPVKENAKGNLYLKGDVIRNTW